MDLTSQCGTLIPPILETTQENVANHPTRVIKSNEKPEAEVLTLQGVHNMPTEKNNTLLR